MNRQLLFRTFLVGIAGAILATTMVDAQQEERRQRQRPGQGQRRGGGPRGFGGRGGGGIDLLALTRIEAVQKEVDMLEDQIEEAKKLAEEQRAGRRGGRPGGNRGDGGGRPERPGRGDNDELTDEQRQQRIAEFQQRRQAQQQQQAERAKEAEAKLAEILLPHQIERLKEIRLQLQGTSALQTPEIAAQLNLTDQQKTDVAETSRTIQQEMFGKMRDLFRSGDQESMREKMGEMRNEANAKVMALLTDEQQQQFEEMKGEKFEMPREAFGRGGFGRGGPGGPGGGRGRPGGGGGRPSRPGRPEA